MWCAYLGHTVSRSLTSLLSRLQFIIAAVLPSSSTVVPTQQLVIVSYFILAAIGVFSILTYQLTTYQKRRERARKIK